MKLKLFLNKTLEQNAGLYYELSKKTKKKLEGAKKALEDTKLKILDTQKKVDFITNEKKEKKLLPKKEWYEKFRWFLSSEGFFCIGGRDATTNDIIVKKHLEKGDLVFHTELPGSPFFVVKSKGETIGPETIKETAIACAAFSRAWKSGVSSAEVYYVNIDQIKKELGLPKGTFMIYGKRSYLSPKIELAIGINSEDKIMCGPIDAIKKNCQKFCIITQGQLKKSDASKKIKRILGGEIDAISSVLPPGDVKVIENINK